MAEKDITEKLLADYNDVFADIMNVLLFDGEMIINEHNLKNTGDKSVYKAGSKIHQQERDLIKIWNKRGVYFSILGLEHQTKYDAKMPLRVIGYDGGSYRRQCLRRYGKRKKCPVITIVLNFSKKRWGKNKALSDCFEVDEKLKPYFSDYRINVFDIAYLTDEQVKMFKSDFRIVADYFVQIRKNKEYVPTKEDIKHVDEILKLMSVLTADNRFEEIQNDGGKVRNMCEVLDRIEARGIQQGKRQQLIELAKKGLLSIVDASVEADMTMAEFEKLMEKASQTS